MGKFVAFKTPSREVVYVNTSRVLYFKSVTPGECDIILDSNCSLCVYATVEDLLEAFGSVTSRGSL